MTAQKKRNIRDKVRKHRERMRANGLRPVQVRVPDTRTESFRKEAHRQSLAVAKSEQDRADQEFIDAISASFDS